MELGKQIKNCRQEANLSQEELAERVYVSRQTISNWENDKSYPDVNSLVLLSEVFHISLDKLYVQGLYEESELGATVSCINCILYMVESGKNLCNNKIIKEVVF